MLMRLGEIDDDDNNDEIDEAWQETKERLDLAFIQVKWFPLLKGSTFSFWVCSLI